jgi:hypothetical protein
MHEHNVSRLSVNVYIYLSSPIKDPGCPSSVRISMLREVPNIPDQAQNTKYKVPVPL